MGTVRAVAIQMGATTDKRANLDKALKLIDQAVAEQRQVDLVALPEYCYAVPEREELAVQAEPIGGEFTQRMEAKAREHGSYLVAGTFPERGADGKVYNTALIFDRNGRRIGEYRKIHLLLAPNLSQEAELLAPGNATCLVETDFGKVGVMVCYDLRFPELHRTLCLQGADILVFVAAWLSPRGPHWEILTRSAALQNLCHVVVPDQIGRTRDKTWWGHSVIVDPWGTVLAQAPDREGPISANLDLDYQREVRQKVLIYQHRRTDLYRL